MFRRDLLSIIKRFNAVFTATGICHTSYVDCLFQRSRPKYVESFTKIKVRNSASCWLLLYEQCCHSSLYPADGSSDFLRNVNKFRPDSTTPYPRRLCSSVPADKTSSHYQTCYPPQQPYLKAHSICNFCNRMTFQVTHPSKKNQYRRL